MKAATDTLSLSAARARFQSTPPVKAATLLIEGIVKGILFQSTPPVKAATNRDTVFAVGGGISIHAAREGGDQAYKYAESLNGISIHAAREGGDRNFNSSRD